MDVSLAAPLPGSRVTPRVTVVVTARSGADGLEACLGSLVAQTLPAERFEVLVVAHGTPLAAAPVVERLRAAHPAHAIRLLETTQAGEAQARNLGLDAARGVHVTFLDAGGTVAPAYLATLLAAARPRVVPALPASDLPSRYRAKLAGSTLPAAAVEVLLRPAVGKLVPTALARRARFTLQSNDTDVGFWVRVHADHPFRVHVCSGDPGPAPSPGGSGEGADLVGSALDTLAALQQVVGGNAETDRLRQAAEDGPVDVLREHLQEHPDAREQLAAAARERGVRLPWRELNRGTARDLAILFCFTPFLDTSALVAARRLRGRGLVTDVISQDMSNVRDVDPASDLVAEEYVDEARILPGKAEFAEWPAIVAFAEAALAQVAELQERKGRYRSVYSRAMVIQSHFAAAVLKLRQPEIHWQAEFSDPVRVNAAGEERVGRVGEDDWLVEELRAGVAAAGFELPSTKRLYEWAEMVAFALADEIVFTNEHQLRFMLDSCPDPKIAARADTVSVPRHHPTLPEHFYRLQETRYRLEPGVVHLAYFGAFWSNRGISEVIAALESLTPAERARIRLHVFSNKPDKQRIDVLRRGLADVITVNGYEPFLAYLNLTLRFDALIVNDAATVGRFPINPYLPSKVSDYRGSGSPVWAIVEPGSVLSTLPTDHRSSLGDEDGAARVLRELLAAGPRSDRGT